MSDESPDTGYEFDGEYECPVCAEPLETVEDVYEHVRFHGADRFE